MAELTADPDTIRALLRECVTVVQPGEVLVMRFDRLTHQDAHRIREVIHAWNIDNDADLKVLPVSDADLAVLPADGVIAVPLTEEQH